MKRCGPAVLVLILLLLVFGCGKKTRPVPPQTLLPAAVSDLRYLLDEKGATLTWTPPQRTRNGDRFVATLDYVIARAQVSADDYCPDCPVQYSERQVLEGDDLGVAATMSFSDSDLQPGYRYYYKVAARMGALFQGPESNFVSFWWQVPVMAPQNFTIAEGDGQLALTWQPPPALIDHSPVTGMVEYRIYRSTDGLNFVQLDSQLSNLFYIDRDVRNGVTYAYRVRAVRVLDDTSSPGVASPILSGTPRE